MKTNTKVLLIDDLLDTLLPLRQQGKTIVTTNGCFDILHVGHLRYLQAARQLGDVLVVLLNSDTSVQQLKGPKRPLVPVSERAEMLSGLACVDYVTIFDDTTPVAWLEKIQPHIHVKGGDYTAATLPEVPVLERVGAQLRFIPMVEGRSTTDIVQRIIDVYQQPV